MSLHFHPLRVKSVRPDTDDAVIVCFDVPEDIAGEFRFTQGQHLTLRHTLEGVEQRRSYSICSGVDDGELRVGVRKVPGGASSSRSRRPRRATTSVSPAAAASRRSCPS
jgi:ring-1,2-phenylacetyl-CoA epoxidase subunit PaaE